MGSFFGRKNKAFRIGVPLLLLLSTVSAGLFGVPTASAETYPQNFDNTSRIIVHISGSNNPSSYTVTAKRNADIRGGLNDLNFSWQANGPVPSDSTPAFLSETLTWAGDPSACTTASDPTQRNQNQWNIKVLKNGNPVGTSNLVGCGKNYFNSYVLVDITVDDNAAVVGAIKGAFTYDSEADGPNQTFKTSTVAKIKNPAGAESNFSVDDSGNFKIADLAPGEYTLNATYTSGTTDAKTYFVTDKKCTVKSGEEVDCGVKALSTGQSADATKCSDGSAKNAKGECPDDTELNCGGGQLDWLVCGVIGLLGSAADKLDSMMTDMLNINTSEIFDTSQSGGQKGYYAAWNSFRILATALLVIGGLVMVASQALGFEFLDAYTIRKVLPRLLVAVIGISLSWPLMEFVVGFFNTVGTDIRTIMYTPFKNIGGGIDIGVGISTYIGIVVGGLVLGGLGLLSLILTAFLALLVGFVILVIRQLALLVLIILAPIAIACYILPNTQKVSKLWFDNFLGLLMMFPIISALIAAGHIFAAVAFSDGAQTTGFTQLLGLVAYFIPFFLLPMAARLATGIIGTIAGFVNDKNKGVFDRLKKFRGEKAAGNLSAMANGNRFKSENWAANKFNAATHGIANVPNAGFNPMRMKSRMQTAMSRHDMDEAAEFREKSSEFGVIKGNQDFLEAAIDGHGNDAKVREILSNLKATDGVSPRYSKDTVDQGVAAIRAARRSASPEVFETAAALSLPSTGTAFKIQRDAQGNITGGGAGEMHQRINQVAGKDRVKASRMLADMRTSAMQARRPLLAGGGYASQLGVLEEQFNGTESLAGASERIVGESLEGQGGSYIVSARKSDVEAAAPTMISKLVAASSSAKATSQELASIEGKYSAASNFAPENARVIADNVMSKQVALPTVTKQADGSYATEMKTMTVREHIEARRNTDPEFQSMSKQFHAASESTEASLRAAEARSSGGGRRS